MYLPTVFRTMPCGTIRILYFCGHKDTCLGGKTCQDCATLGNTVLLHLPPGQCKDVQSALLWSCGDTTTKHTWNRVFLRFV